MLLKRTSPRKCALSWSIIVTTFSSFQNKFDNIGWSKAKGLRVPWSEYIFMVHKCISIKFYMHGLLLFTLNIFIHRLFSNDVFSLYKERHEKVCLLKSCKYLFGYGNKLSASEISNTFINYMSSESVSPVKANQFSSRM